MILLAKLIPSTKLFDWHTKYDIIRDTIACYVKNYPEEYNEEAKLLKQQLFASSWIYFIEGVWVWNLVSCALLALPIVTENVGILYFDFPGIVCWNFLL